MIGWVASLIVVPTFLGWVLSRAASKSRDAEPRERPPDPRKE